MPSLNRRSFLTNCGRMGAAGAFVAASTVTWGDVLLAANDRPLQDDSGLLVVVTLYGGNDGLNTLVPYAASAYQDARPELAYGANEVLVLDDFYGLNPGMEGLAQLFADGSLAIVRGVGYPEPDHSHFRSMDIWQSASLDNAVTTGWIGRWLDANGKDPLSAIHVGPILPTLAIGEKCSAAAFLNGDMLSGESSALIRALSKSHADDTPAMAMVCDSLRSTAQVSRKLSPMFTADGAPRLEFDEQSLMSQLDVVAACIIADVPTRVYSVGLGGFDTHADERETQQELLRTLDVAVTRFLRQMSQDKRGKDLTVLAYSEFGRRVPANSSDGTDHGTAGPVFVMGERVRGGFYGEDPSLTDLVRDDLQVTTDFRDVYNEILLRALHTDPEPALGPGRSEIGFLSA